MNTRLLAPILGISAFWPLLRWYVYRLSDGSEDAIGLLALITAVALAIFDWRNRISHATEHRPAQNSSSWLWPSSLVLLYIALLPHAPNLVLAILMVITLWLGLRRYIHSSSNNAPLLGMLLLSLPTISSLNFFLGFPLRLLIAKTIANILLLYGMVAHLNGTSLLIEGREVSVDAPCSGIHFLWFSCYLSLLLAHLERATSFRTLSLVCIGGVAAILGNLFRTLILSLFCAVNLSFIADQIYVHEIIGATFFCLTGALVIIGARLTYKRLQLNAPGLGIQFNSIRLRHLEVPQFLFCFLCLVAMSSPLVAARPVDSTLAIKPDLWAEQFASRNLARIQLSKQEREFQTHFPGRIAKFSKGREELILRTIDAPTRQLHPAQDCLRGSGYKIQEYSLTKDKAGALWNTLTAEKGPTRIEVKERIIDHHGNSWAKVSDWYWAAMLGQSRAPWLSITKASPID